jgi:hypothetical protein
MRQRRILAGNPFWPGDEARPGLGTAGRGRDQKALPTESIPDPLEFSADPLEFSVFVPRVLISLSRPRCIHRLCSALGAPADGTTQIVTAGCA